MGIRIQSNRRISGFKNDALEGDVNRRGGGIKGGYEQRENRRIACRRT